MDASDAIDHWVAAGEIDEQLGQRLRSSLATVEAPERSSRLIAVLATVGAVLIGGGLLLFLASQWDQSSPVRRVLLLLAVHGLVVAGAAVAEQRRLGISARALWFLASISVGANIFLLGQIFNLPLTYWQGTALWALAALAMGWASPSAAQGWLVVPLAVLTLAWLPTPPWQQLEQLQFLVDPAGLLPLAPLVGMGLIATAMMTADSPLTFLRPAAAALGALLVAGPITVSTFHPAMGAVAILLIGLLPQVPGRSFDGGSVPWLSETFRQSPFLFFLYGAVVAGFAVAAIVVGQRIPSRAMVNGGFWTLGVVLFAAYIGRLAGALPTSAAVTLGGLLLVGGAVFMEQKRRQVIGDDAGDPGGGLMPVVPGADS